jgi:type II secretory pathway pseudopilin PulG
MAIRNHNKGRTGFTLMELLVVIAIIMALIGILVPGIRGVKRIAKNLEQKSLYHNIEIGMETYRKDFGDYPESRRKQKDGAGPYYTGAQHLAEALVGRDSRGFEPIQSRKWQWPGDEPSTEYGLYAPESSPLYAKSLARRKPLYINLKDTGAFLPGEMYSDTGDVVSEVSGQRAPIVADMFYRKKITLASTGETVKIGSPILYFKANTGSDVYFKDIASRTNFQKWKFNFYDNEALIDLKTMEDQSIDHEMDAANFYKSIADRNAPFDRPLNEKTYILISAGYDGIYGTKDDVTNIKIK